MKKTSILFFTLIVALQTVSAATNSKSKNNLSMKQLAVLAKEIKKDLTSDKITLEDEKQLMAELNQLKAKMNITPTQLQAGIQGINNALRADVEKKETADKNTKETNFLLNQTGSGN